MCGRFYGRPTEINGWVMDRLQKAFINSARAMSHLVRYEKAIQQELIILGLAIPVAAYIASSAATFLFLTGSLVFLLLVEVLNTGLERACDAVSRSFVKEIQIAKDCGSLAVLISIFLVGTIWLYVLARIIWPLST